MVIVPSPSRMNKNEKNQLLLEVRGLSFAAKLAKLPWWVQCLMGVFSFGQLLLLLWLLLHSIWACWSCCFLECVRLAVGPLGKDRSEGRLKYSELY